MLFKTVGQQWQWIMFIAFLISNFHFRPKQQHLADHGNPRQRAVHLSNTKDIAKSD